MFKFNKKGEVAVIAVYVMAAAMVIPIVKHVQSGQAKKNGQTIWCKVQNKGADYCDAQYR